MIKWLFSSALLINLFAWAWLSSDFYEKRERVMREEGLTGGAVVEIVLLSELDVLPANQLLSIKKLGPFGNVLAAPAGSPPVSSEGLQEGLVGASEFQMEGEGRESGLSALEDVLEEASLLEGASGEDFSCVALGYFDKKTDASRLVEKLKVAADVVARINSVNQSVRRYLVYIPPFSRRVDAEKKRSELRKRGIRSALYYAGELRNGLSLGLFGSRENADRSYEGLRAAGYEVLMREVVTGVVRYQIEIEGLVAAKLSQQFWNDIAERFPYVSRGESVCAEMSTVESSK